MLASFVALGVPACGGGGTYQVVAEFDRAVALYEQGDVRVLGINAGHIVDVEVATDRILVTLELDDDVRVPQDAAAIIVPQSLVGERYVQLSPAYVEGGPPPLGDGDTIPLERTTVPVEPDVALEELNRFLNDLNPDGLSVLIENLAEDLEGNGASLNTALGSITDLVETFAERDDDLVAIVERFDDFTQTLVTREAQLGTLLDQFAQTTSILANERDSIQRLLAGLAAVSQSGLRLVGEHGQQLQSDLDTLGRVTQSIVANLDAVAQLLDAGPVTVAGLATAVDPETRSVNLRNQFGPLAQAALNPLLRLVLGDPNFNLPCIPLPLLGQSCETTVAGASRGPAVPIDLAPVRTPVDDVLALLGAPSATAGSEPAPSLAERIASGAGDVGGFLRDAGQTLVGVG